MLVDLITTQDQVDRELVFTAPKDRKYYTLTPTGDSETTHTEGEWVDIIALAASTCAEYEPQLLPQPGDPLYHSIKRDKETGALTYPGNRVTCTVTRKAGAIGELTIRKEPVDITYLKDSDDDDDEEVEDAAGDYGSSREKPTYDYAFNSVEQPILTHPIFKQATVDQLVALKMYMEGAGPKELVKTTPPVNPQPGQSYPPYRQLWELINAIPAEWLKRVRRTPNYLDIQIELTVSYKLNRRSPYPDFPLACTIQEPPGPIKTPRGRNWLFVGGAVQSQGKTCTATEKYILSGPDGWDEDLYAVKKD